MDVIHTQLLFSASFYSTQLKNQPFQHTDRNGQRKMACRHANVRATPILASVCVAYCPCGAGGITTRVPSAPPLHADRNSAKRYPPPQAEVDDAARWHRLRGAMPVRSGEPPVAALLSRK